MQISAWMKNKPHWFTFSRRLAGEIPAGLLAAALLWSCAPSSTPSPPSSRQFTRVFEIKSEIQCPVHLPETNEVAAETILEMLKEAAKAAMLEVESRVLPTDVPQAEFQSQTIFVIVCSEVPGRSPSPPNKTGVPGEASAWILQTPRGPRLFDLRNIRTEDGVIVVEDYVLPFLGIGFIPTGPSDPRCLLAPHPSEEPIWHGRVSDAADVFECLNHGGALRTP